MNGNVRRLSTAAGDARIFYLPDADWYEYCSPRQSLELLLPREWLDRVAGELEAQPLERLGYGADVVSDLALHNFARMALPYVARPELLEPLWADQFFWAFTTYVCARHGDLVTPRARKGGLTHGQARLAQDMIEASLSTTVHLAELASLCGVRTSQFAHAFRISFGVSPYRWLIQRRIARSQTLLLSGACLAEVALACGFADQSHLTRAFQRVVGTSPGAWRATCRKRVFAAD